MPAHKKDFWTKPRTQGDRLTNVEIAKLRAAYDAGICADDIACELELSSRNARKYYAMFRGTPRPRGRPSTKPKVVLAPPPKPPQKSRFYTSTFEL